MRKQQVMFAAVAMVFLCAGCAGSTAGPATRQGAELDVFVVAEPYVVRSGDVVAVTVRAKNNTDEVIDFGRGSSGCWFSARIRNERTGEIVSFTRMCTADYAYRTLGPGEEHSESLTWRCSTRVGDAVVPVPVGTYQIFGVARDNESQPVSVRVRQ